jgi:hypothetical protein
MADHERRKDKDAPRAALRNLLNEEQLMTLRDLERFGWELRFVRRPLFQDPIPVLVDGDRKTFSVLKPDGSLDDDPKYLKLRTSAAVVES